MEEIVTKVERQELEITYIKKSLDELVEQNKKQNEQLVKISESIQKQEVILEKVSNLEDKYTDGLKRVHKRIDEELARCKDSLNRYEKEVGDIKKDLISKPCQNHSLIEKEIDFIKKQQEKHAKIFWWGATLFIGTVVIAILKSHLK